MPRGIKNVVKDPLLGEDEGAETPVAPVTEVVAPKKGKMSADEFSKNSVANTKAILDASEHTNFIIPLGENEAEGTYESVQINGYRLSIRKGVMVNVPMAVANLLAEKYRIAMTAGADKKTNRSAKVSDILE